MERVVRGRSRRVRLLGLVFGWVCLLLVTACRTVGDENGLDGAADSSYIEVDENSGENYGKDSDKKSDEDIDKSDDLGGELGNWDEQDWINIGGDTIAERFEVLEGFARVESRGDSFAYYLQNLRLKPDGAKVRYYDGREKVNDVYLAVAEFSLGDRDLQQCADSVIRLRAEYLYEQGRYDEIQFHFFSGFNAEFTKWADGNGILVEGNQVSWTNNSNNNSSYESFQRYLDIVYAYAYASTLSLEKELAAKEISEIEIGDVFIQGGSPGHCVIVVDMAVNEESSEKAFMLAQGYMPAQDIQILKGNNEDSPWYLSDIEETLKTPEWTFLVGDLKTWN